MGNGPDIEVGARFSSRSCRAGLAELDLTRVWMLPNEHIRGAEGKEVEDVRRTDYRRAAGVGGVKGE